MITKETITGELYVWIHREGKKELLYKRWLKQGYGMVMCRQPFTAKDVERYKEGV
jgi:hypothetical protein